MELRSRFTSVVLVIYLILVITFIVCERNQYGEILEHYGNPKCSKYKCINFCLSSKKYSDNTLRKGLRNISTYNSEFYRKRHNNNKTFVIVRNELKCNDFELKVIAEDLKNVRMSSGSYMQLNKINLLYCLDAYENSGEIRFNGYFCEANRPLFYAVCFLLVIITCFLLITPIVIYLMIDEFKSSLHGRLCITLLVLQIFMVVFYPLVDIGFYFDDAFGGVIFIIMGILACSSNICVTIMVFDIFISLKYFNDPDFQRQPYWTFFVKLFGVVYVLVNVFALVSSEFTMDMLSFLKRFIWTIFVFFVILLVIDIILLMDSYSNIKKLREAPEMTENTRFIVEQQRFFLYVLIFVIYSIMWLVEFIPAEKFSYGRIIANVIKVMSAAIIAQSLLANPKVRALFVEKYISLNNNFHDANTVLMEQ